MEYCKHEYNAKLEKEKEIIEKEFKSKLDNLTNQVNVYVTIIENKNEEIKINISKIIELERKNKNLKEKLSIAKEVTKFYSKCFLDVYHLKT